MGVQGPRKRQVRRNFQNDKQKPLRGLKCLKPYLTSSECCLPVRQRSLESACGRPPALGCPPCGRPTVLFIRRFGHSSGWQHNRIDRGRELVHTVLAPRVVHDQKQCYGRQGDGSRGPHDCRKVSAGSDEIYTCCHGDRAPRATSCRRGVRPTARKRQCG